MRWIFRIAGTLVGVLLLLILLVLALYAYRSSRVNGEIVSLGKKREFLLYVPENYDPLVRVPLVISLHGAYLYPGFQMRLSGWNELADREGFIVVYPKAAGLPAVWGLTPGEDLRAEVQFFSDLIDSLSETYSIDPGRIYANGYSNGAAMTIMLSCRLPDRIAAFGMVATPVVPWEWCEGSDPTPVIAIHGTEDPFVPYKGGENFLTTEPLLSMQEWTSVLAGRNQCDPEPNESEPAVQVAVREYTGCADGASVILYSVKSAGHVWPGGMTFPGNLAGPNNSSINATEQMWLFFQDHPLRQ